MTWESGQPPEMNWNASDKNSPLIESGKKHVNGLKVVCAEKRTLTQKP